MDIINCFIVIRCNILMLFAAVLLDLGILTLNNNYIYIVEFINHAYMKCHYRDVNVHHVLFHFSVMFSNIYSSAFLQCFNISSTSFTDVLWINCTSTWVHHFSIIWTSAHVLKVLAQGVGTYNEEESHYPAMLSVTAHIIIVNIWFGICYDSISWRVLTHKMLLCWVYM